MHRNNKKSNPVVFAGFILLEYKESYNQGILHKENYGNYLSLHYGCFPTSRLLSVRQMPAGFYLLGIPVGLMARCILAAEEARLYGFSHRISLLGIYGLRLTASGDLRQTSGMAVDTSVCSELRWAISRRWQTVTVSHRLGVRWCCSFFFISEVVL